MVLYHALILGILVLGLSSLVYNLRRFHTVQKVDPAVFSPETAPFVSILVPARNEERCIEACAGSLSRQVYPHFEVIVLDDHSEDATPQVLERLGFSHDPASPRRILSGEPLPPGWTGKGWACHQLSQAARGEYLLFIDADTRHEPEMLASNMKVALEWRSDLLSSWPHPVTKTWSEKLIIPLIYLALTFYPVALWQWIMKNVENARRFGPRLLRHFGAANGQFILFRREAYERVGGHAANRAHLVEDVALGRAVAIRAGEGLRLFNCDGSRLSEVRMYTRFSELWEGFTKNIRAVFEDSLAAYFLSGGFFLVVFLAPFFLIWGSHGVARWLVAGQIVLIYAIRGVLTLRFRTSWLGWLGHPLGQIIATAIALNSWRCSAGKGVVWKGRRYEVVHPGDAPRDTPVA